MSPQLLTKENNPNPCLINVSFYNSSWFDLRRASSSDYSLPIKILSNWRQFCLYSMKNINSWISNQLENVNFLVLLIHNKRSSSIYLFTGQSWPFQYGDIDVWAAANEASMFLYLWFPIWLKKISKTTFFPLWKIKKKCSISLHKKWGE